MAKKEMTDDQIQPGMLLTFAPNFFPEWTRLPLLDANKAKDKAEIQKIWRSIKSKQHRNRLVVKGKEYCGWVLDDGKQTFTAFASYLALPIN